MVDIPRIAVYLIELRGLWLSVNLPLLAARVPAAFAGALLGVRLLQKVTLGLIRVLVSLMLFGIALGLGAGLI